MSIDNPFQDGTTGGHDRLARRLRCDAEIVKAAAKCPPPPRLSTVRRLDARRRTRTFTGIAAMLTIGLGVATVMVPEQMPLSPSTPHPSAVANPAPGIQALARLRAGSNHLEAQLAGSEGHLEKEAQRIAADVQRLRNLVASRVDQIVPDRSGEAGSEG